MDMENQASGPATAAHVAQKPEQTIDAFTVSPPAITDGQKAMVSWRTSNATRVKLGTEVVAASGSREFSPSLSTNYVLTAEGSAKEPVSKVVSLKVNAPTPAKPQPEASQR